VIYLASPYTHADPAVRQQRFEAVCRVAAGMIRSGKTVFSPIAHSHALVQYGLPVEWQAWAEHDRRFLEACEELVVLMLDGWRESVGVQSEIAIARKLGKPVSFLAPNGQAEENPGLSRGVRGGIG